MHVGRTKTRRASGSDDATDARVSFINVIVASVRVSASALRLLARSAILKPSTFIAFSSHSAQALVPLYVKF